MRERTGRFSNGRPVVSPAARAREVSPWGFKVAFQSDMFLKVTSYDRIDPSRIISF